MDYIVNGKIYEEMLEWPAEWRVQMFVTPVLRKETIEVQAFLVYEGRTLRCDCEVELSHFSTPYTYNWNEEDAKTFAKLVKMQIDSGLKVRAWDGKA